MQRTIETKASASRIEFYLLFIFFLLGGTGFFLSLSGMIEASPETGLLEMESQEKQVSLSKVEETSLDRWNTYEVNDYEITADTEIKTYPETRIKIYANSIIGLYSEKKGEYEITFRSKKNNKIIFREIILL
ncbi:MAG: hypothetical protein ACKOZZ_17660 [Bacteroidota bacterium]|jgi:hypothetical protein